MGLFKGIKQSKERQKAKAFYETAFHLPNGTRETRKLRSVLGNRTTAFIDMTFIAGAKQTEAYIEAMKAPGAAAPEKPSAPCYREVGPSAMYGCIYLRATAIIFSLGSKYQQSIITPSRVFEISDTLALEISEALMLDHHITPLQFLNNSSSPDDPEAEETDPS